MAFQTVQAQRLAGLKPVDGVFQLEAALRQIDEHLNNITPSSPSYVELGSLKQSYTQYLQDAKELRQKGMDSFRKYLKMKNTSNTTEPSDEAQIHTNDTPQQSQDAESINIAQNAHTVDAMNRAQAISNEFNAQYIDIDTSEEPETASAIVINNNVEDDNDDMHIQLMEENNKLREQIEALMKNKAEHEETEHELRLILEEYKFTQLSHKQEIHNLQSTLSTYKKASDTKRQSLDTLSNECETIKNNNTLITKQNTALKQQITQYLNENTMLKEKYIECVAQCEGLKRENTELKQTLALSQQLNAPHTVIMDNIDAPVVPKQAHIDCDDNDTQIEERLQRVYNMVKKSGNHDIVHELEGIMEAFHPIKIVKSTQNMDKNMGNQTMEGEYVLTKEEYADIEKVIDDRDRYLNKAIVYEKNIKILNDKYQDIQRRLTEITEEKSLMMRTLKDSVENLAQENIELRSNMDNLNHERSSIKEHDLKTQNDFYKVSEENRERKYEMNTMKQKIHELNRDIETYTYLSQQLKGNNGKLNTDLANSLERIDRLIQDKEIIAQKLRESNKLTQEILKERHQIYNKPKTAADIDGTGHDMTESKDNDMNEWRVKYDMLWTEKGNLETMFHENECTVNELTNQIIELENRLRNIELENELLKKEIKQITEDNNRKTNQIKSAQRVALSIMQSNKDGMNGNLIQTNNRDMFGLQPHPEPDLITSLLTYLLPFLFEDDDQPKIV